MTTQLAMQRNPEEVHQQQTAAGMQIGGEEEQMEVRTIVVLTYKRFYYFK